MTATGGRSSREKGARAERALVAYLRSIGLDAWRTASGYHDDGGDIYWPASPYVLDVKHQERVRLPEWWREVAAEAANLNRRPLLVLRRPGSPSPATWLAVAPCPNPPAGARPVTGDRVRIWHAWNTAGKPTAGLALTIDGEQLQASTVANYFRTYKANQEASQ